MVDDLQKLTTKIVKLRLEILSYYGWERRNGERKSIEGIEMWFVIRNDDLSIYGYGMTYDLRWSMWEL